MFMKKKRKNKGLFDKKYLFGIREDLSCTPEELKELKKLLEDFKKNPIADDTKGDVP